MRNLPTAAFALVAAVLLACSKGEPQVTSVWDLDVAETIAHSEASQVEGVKKSLEGVTIRLQLFDDANYRLVVAGPQPVESRGTYRFGNGRLDLTPATAGGPTIQTRLNDPMHAEIWVGSLRGMLRRK